MASRVRAAMRPLGRTCLIMAPIILTLALSRCGKPADDDDEGSPSPEASGVPADWDGLTDYSRSAFEVIDE